MTFNQLAADKLIPKTKPIFNQNFENMEIDSLAEHLCAYFNTSVAELRQKNRKREVVEVRQMIMTYMNKFYSLSETGKYFLLDHATVVHSKKVVDNLANSDAKFKVKWDEFTEYAKILFKHFTYGGFKVETNLSLIKVTYNDIVREFSTMNLAKAYINGFNDGKMENKPVHQLN